METIKFFTLGCKVNQYDTQRLREAFVNSGFREIDNGRRADIYLINTCTVTHKADTDSLKLIRRARNESSKAKIIVTGCMAQLDSAKIKSIDDKIILVRNEDKERISQVLSCLSESTRKRKNESTSRGISDFANHTRAFLKIQDGCDNLCSYCKVPLVRGASRSRKPEEIIPEAHRLVKAGFKEIVLTGICLGAFGKELKNKITLTGLIKRLEEIKGLLRLRLSSIEAQDVTDDLIKVMAGSEKICRHLHIPIQSGDDKILKKMLRRYTAKDYLALIKKIRHEIPQIAITTDCLVGFPGETESNFLNTVRLIEKIKPLKTHIFPYSLRQGTAAWCFKERVDAKIIRERIDFLKKTSDTCALSYKKEFQGKVMDVLVECRWKKKPEFWQGHTDNYLPVLIKSGVDLKNKIVSARLKTLSGDWILADLIC